jgi:diadenosine tetraphosphate (Ap4A) HIT family hydrolase
MSKLSFELDSRLKNDTQHVQSLSLCDVLLMNDARFAWLILVPRRAQLSEIADLSLDAQAMLWREVHIASQALQDIAPCDKLNIGALGNIVRQLHVHVVTRREGDAAWPGPVWGSGKAEPYEANALNERIERLRSRLAHGMH